MMNKFQVATGLTALFFGVLVYAVDRPGESVFFINKLNYNISLYNKVPSLFGSMGYNLPAFIHVFSFSLLTAGLIVPDKYRYFYICIFWFLTNSLFELGQKYHILATKILPDWLENVPVLSNTQSFFTNGTFDYFDIIGFAVGGIAAYALLILTGKKELSR